MNRTLQCRKSSKGTSRVGRPPKFHEARKPVTVTLPERTLSHLAAISPDRAKAIVKTVDAFVARKSGRKPAVETIAIAPDSMLIIVPPSRALREIPWIHMVEISPGRHLIAVQTGTSIEQLELAILDLLDSFPASDQYEREILTDLRTIIGGSRRERKVTKAEILFISTQA